LVPARTTATPYVALGDSFSSGEGVPPFDRSTTIAGRDTCHRSSRAWPLLLAGRNDGDTYSLACSGATLAEVTEGDDRRVERDRRSSQVARLARIVGVRLVSVTIGGNDAGFARVLRRCATHLRCDRYYTAGGHDRLKARIGALAARLPAAYTAIRRAAPAARFAVVGYPRLFPLHPGRFTCAALGSIGPEEVRYLNARTADLDATIRNAARAADAAYVDVLDGFAGHAIGCAGAQWVNHLRLVHPEYSFHPNAAGQERLAELVERWMLRTPEGG
jgi:lysophospholipase L1-like esterase